MTQASFTFGGGVVNNVMNFVVACWLCLAVTGAVGTADSRAGQRESSDASQCPDLSGLYSDEGKTIHDGAETPSVAHLSWLIGGGKEQAALTPLWTMPAPGKPSTYFVKSIRVSHPAFNRFAFEALDGIGNSIGVFSFGPEDGWRCASGAFLISRKSEGGGEGTWGDTEMIHKLYRGPDGAFVRSAYDSFQQRSVFLLGGPVGSLRVSNFEFHFPLLSK